MCCIICRAKPVDRAAGNFVCRAIVALISICSVAVLDVRADDGGRPSGSSYPVQPAGGFNPPNTQNSTGGVFHATHTEPEPTRSPGAVIEKAPALPAPPHGLSAGEKSSGGPRTLGAIVTVAASLAVVLGLFWGCAWLMRRGMPSTARRLPTEVVDVLGRAPLAGRQQMHVVRFGNKMLLVCASPSGVDTLGEITDPAEIDRLAGMCEQSQPNSATTAFKQIFGQITATRPAKNLAAFKSARAEEAADV